MIDITDITVRAGDGGDGMVSFRREKGVPKGGPDGGDGGNGGSVFLVGSSSMAMLAAFKHKREYHAARGENGRGKDQHGKSGANLDIAVPCGCVVSRHRGKIGLETMGEVLDDGQRLLVAQGGGGGLGNAAFATAIQRTPYVAERGSKGQEGTYRLELRLLADVGIIGKPNAGKSTLLSAASAARPKVGAYPFTTTEPQLGVVSVGWRTFIMTEIPGLLEGAHLGIGLGHAFLRHATRTRVLVHLVDGSVEDVAGALRDVNEELKAYGGGLDQKPQIIVVNKDDLPEVASRREDIAKDLSEVEWPVYFISAAAQTGIEPVLAKAAEVLLAVEKPKPLPVAALEAQPEGSQGQPVVLVEDGVYVVLNDQAVRLVAGSDLGRWAGRAQVKVHLDKLGVTQAAEAAGIQPGDTVRFGDIELEW